MRIDEPIPLRARLARLAGRVPLIGAGPRTRLARALLKPEEGEANFEINLFDGRYRGKLGNYIDWSIYVLGAYEPKVLAALGRLADNRQGRGLFLDVGANCGQHSLYMAGRMEQVCSVEPFPELADRIEGLVELNALSGRWRLERVGLGALPGELFFSPPDPTNLGTGSFAFNRPGGQVKLPIVKGDALPGVGDLAILKIDVEGFEQQVIAGLRDSIARSCPDIIMEWSPKTREDFGGIEGLLSILPGYQVFDIEGRHVDHSAQPDDLMLLPISA